MVIRQLFFCVFVFIYMNGLAAKAEQAGSIRGTVYDKDFEVPLAEAQISIAETGEIVMTSDAGHYVFPELDPGNYALVFSKDGYIRQVRANVVVSAGRMTELDISLSGDFTDMEEFIVQNIQLGGNGEIGLLELRMESPSLMDSISADLMSQAGAGDAASALKLVAGATVQDGKYAVIRGLPDRYVNSQLNGIRLPTADTDKRAVQLDQFPSAAIESIQVSKTFTPDQQGDASGGAVNVVLKGIPDEAVFKFNTSTSYNTQSTGNNDFLTYKDGGLNLWGSDDGGRDIQNDNIGQNWDGAVGVSPDDAPWDYKWSLSGGGKYDLSDDIRIGGLGSFFYERDSSFYKNGIDDKYWVESPGSPMTPQYSQGTPEQGDFKTSLFDVTQASQEVKWGALGVVGIETENNTLKLINLYTRAAEDTVTLAEDTRGKEFYFPGYDANDPMDPGNRERDAAPYLRTETLQYTERITQTTQLSGWHRLPDPGLSLGEYLTVLPPEFDWSLARSSSQLNQPDKRQFGSLYWAEAYNPGYPPYLPPSTSPEVQRPFKPAANFTMGNVQRVWKDITEESDQYAVNLKFPFSQWTGDEGYFKFGIFNDKVNREYNQDSFSNFNDNTAQYQAPWDELWSQEFPDENHPITPADIDVDYLGEQNISAWYYMADIPLNSYLSFQGGLRHENTELSIINTAESEVTWIPAGASGSVTLNPGDADVFFEQSDVLPSIGFVLTPLEQVTLRGVYSETVARQTFKELTPIQQQEYLGGDVFIGNPYLKMSSLKNYDLRLDYVPYQGGLVSLSYFYKDIKNPIENVQKIADFAYTTPVNYPEGSLSGYEIEARQQMGRFWNKIDGLSVGANATLINSEVTLPDDEAAELEQPNIDAPMPKRDMTNAPNHLYNLFLTYDLDNLGLTGTQVALFYTVRGDALIAGAGQAKGNFIPNVYEKEYGTLNFSLSKKFGKYCDVKLQAKNLLDPDIDTVYRSDLIGGDVTKTSYKKGREFSISFGATF